MKIAPGGTSQIADAPREASASRPRRRRSATHTPHSSRQLHEPPRPRPGTARPRGRFDSARRSRHRPRRPRRRRWRTSRRCTCSPGCRTRRSRAGRMPSAPHSVPRSPCSAARAGRLQPAASAHAPRSGGERRGSSPSRSRTSHRSSPVGRIEPPRRRPSPAALLRRHAGRPWLRRGTSRRRATLPRSMRDPFSRCPPAAPDRKQRACHRCSQAWAEAGAFARESRLPPAAAPVSRGLRDASASPPDAGVKPPPGSHRDGQDEAVRRASDGARARAG